MLNSQTRWLTLREFGKKTHTHTLTFLARRMKRTKEKKIKKKNKKKQNKKKKKNFKVVRRAELIIGQEQCELEQFYNQASIKKFNDNLSPNYHPLHSVADVQKSKRHPGRFISFPSRTTRFLNSYIPTTIWLINEASSQ